MPKNIVIFADGTGQIGGLRPDQRLSNIYKLYRATRSGPDSTIDPRTQVAFYDPGLGTIDPSGGVRSSLLQKVRAVLGLALGYGLRSNLIDCYEAILRHYQPGDRIYLFGFSRGGYTVRALANVLNLCGVPTQDGEGNPLPRAGRKLREIAREAVVKVYEHGAGRPRPVFEPQREAIARRFRARYGAGSHPDRGDVFPHFVGVFDAVAALGLPIAARVVAGSAAIGAAGGLAWAAGALAQWRGWTEATTGTVWTAGVLLLLLAVFYGRVAFKWASEDVREGGPRWHLAIWYGKNYDRFLDRRIPVVRHALAIDERRAHFARVEWGSSKNADRSGDLRPHFRQRWFAGNHSDIGGSYPEEESRLSDIPLDWMISEATMGPDGLLIDRSKLQLYPDPLGMQHCELFEQAQKQWWQRLPWPEKRRAIDPDNAELDPSVLTRLGAPLVQQCDHYAPYRPQSLRTHVKAKAFYT